LKTTSGKWRLEEPPVFFTDRTFGKAKLADMLRQAEFTVVTHYEEYGDEGHRIADPAIIGDCGLKNRVLLTGDQDLIYTYALEIKHARIAVFVTTDNNEGPDKWGPRIIAAKQDLWRELSRRPKPFTARISREGRVTQVRIHEKGEWKTITVGQKRLPHQNRQKG
jgi:hypothetical protein